MIYQDYIYLSCNIINYNDYDNNKKISETVGSKEGHVMNYITLIFDIQNSRHISNREEVQYLLIDTIRKCNETFKDILEAHFLITIGDEWEGLLKPQADYRKIIEFYREHLPTYVSFYTGVGIGKVVILNHDLTVNQLDGPSFYLAREALNYAKNHNHKVVVISDDYKI